MKPLTTPQCQVAQAPLSEIFRRHGGNLINIQTRGCLDQAGGGLGRLEAKAPGLPWAEHILKQPPALLPFLCP